MNNLTGSYKGYFSTFLSLTEHDSVDDEADDVLHDEDGDGGRTLFCYHPSSEADGHLNLDGEQEGRRERPEETEQTFILKFKALSLVVAILASLSQK